LTKNGSFVSERASVKDLAIQLFQAGALVQHVRTVPGDGVIDHVPLDDAIFHKAHALASRCRAMRVADDGVVLDRLED
jgi:hypothetical protein